MPAVARFTRISPDVTDPLKMPGHASNECNAAVDPPADQPDQSCKTMADRWQQPPRPCNQRPQQAIRANLSCTAMLNDQKAGWRPPSARQSRCQSAPLRGCICGGGAGRKDFRLCDPPSRPELAYATPAEEPPSPAQPLRSPHQPWTPSPHLLNPSTH